jgi:2',3'-cyclic-nucleotide 2'-phosphodiesterase (5'-nucleotidase family)
MFNTFRKLITIITLLGILIPSSVMAQPSAPPQAGVSASVPLRPQAAAASEIDATGVVTITVLHTNDFHGNLQLSGSNPGMARTAAVITGVTNTVGAANTLLLDAGDIMQSTLLSNLKKGQPTIDVYNFMGYDAATFGNHEFDWSLSTLISRTQQANFPFVTANIVVSNTGSCSTAGWTSPTFATPWITKTVGTAPNQVVVGITGVTTQETPYITLAGNTASLCFKDPADSIIHYYDAMKAAGAQVIIVLSHLGNTDGGYGYGLAVYGDQTLATKLAAANKKPDLIIGGHSHTDLAAAQVVSGITIAQAHYAGRKVGRADIGVNASTGAVKVVWQRLTVSTSGAEDAPTKARINVWANDPVYLAQIGQLIGYTNVPLVRNYDGDSLMGEFVQDSIYGYLNSDAIPANDVDMVFNNAGGLRADITTTLTYPYTLTYGATYSVLPFGNQTVVGNMTGAQIMELLNQSATLFKGSIQPAGIKFKFYRYSDALPGPQPWAWGAYDVMVKNRTTSIWESLVLTKTYQVATNEFLAPAGQDGFTPFQYMTNITYWGDMLDQFNAYITKNYSTTVTAYNGPGGTGAIDNRIVRNGTNAGGTIIPITFLHHNDSHGRLLLSGTTPGYTQLATLIKQERAHNPTRSILLSAGDNIQGDSMMYYYKSAALGYSADGVTLPITMTINPLIAAFNAMNYSAYTLGNHEFNFGHEVFTSTLQDANYPILQANLYDTGSYGLASVPVKSDVSVSLPGGANGNIDVAILGIGNHRVPNYELPSNIPGLTFTNPIVEAQARTPALNAVNDVVVALTHIGFTGNPASVEVDNNVDTVLAAQTADLDVIIGGHSHTPPFFSTALFGSGNSALGAYKYLPAIVGGPNNYPVIVTQANRYNTYLGEVIVGLLPNGSGGYDVVARSGRYIEVCGKTSSSCTAVTPEDPTIKAIVQPYADRLAGYNNTVLGTTTKPIDTRLAFTQETNGANLQADAAVWELAQHGITVDFHLSGAMTNQIIAGTATKSNPYTLKISDMFTAMPYENSLMVLSMNGPQLKAVLERAYRNYYYYKYVPKQGGYSYYTTCMIDINKMGKITYLDTYPALPNGNNVVSLEANGKTINFADATTFYKVSTVNYLAAGSCNFNDGGTSLWPLNQTLNDTQFYVRDAVINYVDAMNTVAPTIEGRLVFQVQVGTTGATLVVSQTNGLNMSIGIPAGALTQTVTLSYGPSVTPDHALSPADNMKFAGAAFDLDAFIGANHINLTFAAPIVVTIRYTDDDVVNMSEDTLMLYYWDGAKWADAACGAYDRHPNENWLSVPICHLSEFASFARSLYLQYLPWIAR